MTDLGSLPGWLMWDASINDSGQIAGGRLSEQVGWGYINAFLYSDEKMTSLEWPGGFANDINSNGQVVGGHSFLYSDGVTTDLENLISPAPGWNLLDLHGINDRGEIVGYGWNNATHTGYHAVLLTPVPEPTTITLLVAGMVSLFCVVRRRRKH